jgi:restriction endonuclease
MAEWSDYQEEVAKFFRSIGLQADTNVTLKGVRTSHDIDVVVRSNHVGFDLLWLVECKHWKTAVSKLHVLALREIVSDLGADRGILMAESGFQSGAQEAARLTNVQLTSLAELKVTASDALGRAQQADLATAANEIARWQDMSALSDDPVPGPVRSIYLANIDPAEYSKTSAYTFSDLTDEIPPEFEDFITGIKQILAETKSSLGSAYYDRAHKYVILTAAGYITPAQSDKIDKAGKSLPAKYLLTALVYERAN